jgi:hypothetical protein
MSDSASRTVSIDDALSHSVGEAMIRRPKTLPRNALVRDVRRAFERPSVRTVLLVANERFAGAIERDGLPAAARDTAPAIRYADEQPLTATPAMAMSEAIELLETRGEPRLMCLTRMGRRSAGCSAPTATGPVSASGSQPVSPSEGWALGEHRLREADHGRRVL